MKTYLCAPTRSELARKNHTEVLASHIEAAANIYEGLGGGSHADSVQFDCSFWVKEDCDNSEPVEFEAEVESEAFISIGNDEDYETLDLGGPRE